MNIRTFGPWALLGLLLVSAACSPSLKATCKKNIRLQCERLHECVVDQTLDQDNDGTPDFVEWNGTDVDDCVDKRVAGYTVDMGGAILPQDPIDCAAQTDEDICPSTALPNYDARAAADCSQAVEDQSCEDFNRGALPEVCEAICTE